MLYEKRTYAAKLGQMTKVNSLYAVQLRPHMAGQKVEPLMSAPWGPRH